nr:MAG TPA: hypothetical protein [Caudoviricetes sp.]
MIEINTTLAEAIAKCDEINDQLKVLRDMLKPKPVLRLESITRPGDYWELRSEDGLINCMHGTVIIMSNGCRFFRVADSLKPWITSGGLGLSSLALWGNLNNAVSQGVTLKYLAAN